jgi:hypothetical protein
MQAIAERRARPNAKRFYRPYRDGPVFLHHFPALSYWATFIESLRDKSSVYNPKLLKLALMGRSPRNGNKTDGLALKARENSR